MSFKLTVIQQKALALISTAVKHVLLVGGSRSGKTFVSVRTVVLRALAAPNSRHAILRFRFNHVKASVILDTFPKVMALCFPGIAYDIDKTDWYATLPNGSQIWFGGLDDKERTEKILGQEYATLFLNECSQISYQARNMVLTRLAQRCTYVKDGTERQLRLLALYDENPPSKAHWTYKLFVRGIEPDGGKPVRDHSMYGHLFMNPSDNLENLPADYLRELNNMPARMRARFLEGRFAEITAGALWSEEIIDQRRHLNPTPELIRLVVAVDPSGAGDEDNAGNDEIGIVAAGLGIDGRAYILDDSTVKAGPATWGRVAVQTYDRHEADIIIGEKNYGGEMVRHVIKTATTEQRLEGVRCKLISASRGKTVRAEPISALTEQDKIRFAGYFPELEAELVGFTTHGYIGENSPNRADAMIWAVSELFPGITRQEQRKPVVAKEFAPADAGMGY